MYRIEVSEEAEEQLKALDRSVRQRIAKKIDEIEAKVQDLGVDPNVAVEKRLRAPFHRFLQQRVGDWRVWFVDVPEDEVLLVAQVLHKKEAKRRLRG